MQGSLLRPESLIEELVGLEASFQNAVANLAAPDGRIAVANVGRALMSPHLGRRVRHTIA